MKLNDSIILIGEKYIEILAEPLAKYTQKIIPIPANPNLDPRLAYHADLSIAQLDSRVLALAPYLKESKLENELRGQGITLIFPDIEQSAVYPGDVGFNISIFPDRYICNPKTACPLIVYYLTNRRGLRQIDVKQGYTRCSICSVGDNGLICADRGIHKSCIDAGMDSLFIEPGHFDLEGFDYGFIGGSVINLRPDLIAFTGSIEWHPDKDMIFEFLSLHNIDCVFLTDKPAFDIGSAIVIEKN